MNHFKLFLAWFQIFAKYSHFFFVRNHQLHSQCKSHWSSNSKQAQIEPIRDCTSLKNNCSSKPNAVDVTIVNRHRPLFDILSSVQAPEAIPGTQPFWPVLLLYYILKWRKRIEPEKNAKRTASSHRRPGQDQHRETMPGRRWIGNGNWNPSGSPEFEIRGFIVSCVYSLAAVCGWVMEAVDFSSDA